LPLIRRACPIFLSRGCTPYGSRKCSLSYLEWITRLYIKRGVENGVADALSRKPVNAEEGANCNAMVTYQPKWLSDILESYSEDAYVKDLLVKLAVDKNAVPDFSLVNGLLKYKTRI
jgi:hypothetical protein